jgi:hypothetical protein
VILGLLGGWGYCNTEEVEVATVLSSQMFGVAIDGSVVGCIAKGNCCSRDSVAVCSKVWAVYMCLLLGRNLRHLGVKVMFGVGG